MLSYKIISIGTSEGISSPRVFSADWGQARKLWGEVNLRSPKIMEDETELAKYEMSGEIGWFSIPTKETFINLNKFREQFGPFTAAEYDALKGKIFERCAKTEPRKTQAVRNMVEQLDQKITSRAITKEEAISRLYMLMLMGHEIGHHKVIPYDYKRSLLIQEAVAKETGDRARAGHLANLYEDLIINLLLAENNGLPIEALYQKITGKNQENSPLWQIYMRVYEKLLNVQILPREKTVSFLKVFKGTKSIEIPAEMEADAEAVVQLIRESRPSNYIEKCRETARIFNKYMNDQDLANPTPLDGEVKPSSPSEQPGRKAAAQKEAQGLAKRQKGEAGEGQIRGIKEYQGIMTANDLAENATEAAVMYYLDLAREHSVKFPLYPRTSGEEVIEGVDIWDPGEHDVSELDMAISLQMGHQIPGLTTMRRTRTEGHDIKAHFDAPNLVVYIDASGSRPNPQNSLSYPVLGAAIWMQSAINSGASVRVVAFDSRQKFRAMSGFTRDINEAVRHALSYSPSAPQTTFPLEDLRDTFENEEFTKDPLRLVVIYDQEVEYILSDKFNGGSGEDYLKEIQSRGGGDFLLGCDEIDAARKLRDLGFKVHLMRNWAEIVSAASDSAEEIYDPHRHLQKLWQRI
ncbi:hypothetical protein HZB07_00040 [Candidatus Saganbacteria bacterium]|nr:hypothetical protein [Candidatus Saganbacteria bacterium]